MPASFIFKNVSIDRGGRTVWSQGNFTIDSGTITAVIGSNGAGKTTLVEMMLGLVAPTTGEVILNEKRIGYVPQNYDTENDELIRGIDYVSLVAQGTSHLEVKKRVHAALEAVDATDFATKRLSDLSGGQRQRIAIAQALVNDNDLVILDEPLSSLDLDSARQIVEILRRLNAERKITILVVAHDLGLLLPILTGSIYLVDGHAHYELLDDAEHKDYSDLLDHLKTMKVGGHAV
ncbi:MAG: ATP-binding cassette domain-containing protein [Candidatus Ancillula sp.]|nr:ATP-binding cassette domain-containing protein [Candidatus Ancillula sp.]